MVTIEDVNGTYTAETVAEARKLKAARGRAVKKANERYEKARLAAVNRAYLIMHRVLTCGSSPYVAFDPQSEAGRYLAVLQDAADGEPCTGTDGRPVYHLIADATDLPAAVRAKFYHRGEAIVALVTDGGGIVRAVVTEERFGEERVSAVAAYEDADGVHQFATAECPLVRSFHFRGDRKVQPAAFSLAAALAPAVEQMDREAVAIDVRHKRRLEEEAAARKAAERDQ